MKKMKKLFAIGLSVLLMFCMSSCGLIEKWVDYRSNRSYTIHFNANGGVGEMEDFFVERGEDGYLPACTFTKEGYECLAWSTDEDGDSLYGYIPNLTFYLPSSVKNGDTVDLYAVWTTPGFSFKVSGIGFLYSANIVSYSGEVKDVIVPAFTRDHYIDSVTGCGTVRGCGKAVFSGHSEIESVKNFPDRDLAEKLFYDCTSLKRLELRNGNGIESVGYQTFYNCSDLEEIEFSKTSEVSIGEEAFYGCTGIKKIVIPRGITEIGASAFYGWTEEQTIEFLGHNENVFGEEWLNGCSAKIIWRLSENEND